MVALVFDSSPLITYVVQERRWQAVEELLRRADQAVLPTPGLTEVIKKSRDKGNTGTGSEIAAALTGLGVLFEPATTDDLIAAADLLEMSAHHPGRASRTGAPSTLSIADALILAAATRLGHPVVTRDRYWADLAQKKLVAVPIHTF